VGLGIDDPVWDHSTYSKNRDRLLEADIARKFLKGIVEHPKVKPLLSDEHFTVDGTLVAAWASMKSLVAKETGSPASGAPPPDGDGGRGGRKEPEPEETAKPAQSEEDAQMQSTSEDRKSRNAEVDFHGQKRSNATHASTTDPEARLYRKGKGKEARLSFMGHALMENRHGLIVDGRVSEASGTAERDEAEAMIKAVPGRHPITVGGDKGYDTQDFVAGVRALKATPHVAQNTKNRRSAIDGRTTRHPGYGLSQRARKRIEEAFGWMKEIALLRRARHRGKDRIDWQFKLAAAAYNLIRMPKLLGATA
jgi:hypothetical protein